MNTPSQPDLGRVLRELADAPGPANMADRALTGARRRRWRRAALSGAAAAVAVASVLAVPYLFRPDAEPAPAQAGGPPTVADSVPARSPVASPVPCESATEESDEKRVSEANWPGFVRTAIAALPERSDYVLQYAYGVCTQSEPNAANAYAVINLGPKRQHGHLTLNLEATVRPGTPDSCAALRADIAAKPQNADPKRRVVSCQDAGATTPLVFAITHDGMLTVAAIYPDRRMVWMESHPSWPGKPLTLGVDALRPVVTDPALAGLLPRG